MKKLLLTIFSVLLTIMVYSKEIRGAEADRLIKGAELVLVDDESKSIKFIKLSQPSVINTNNYLPWLKQILHLSSDEGFKLYNKERDKYGFTHFKYRITKNGIEIEDALFYVHVKNDLVYSVNGNFIQNIRISNPSVSLTPEKAYKKAKLFIKQDNENWNDEIVDAPKKVLVFKDGVYHLTYKVDVYSTKPLNRQYVFVDANNGRIIKTKDRIHFNDVVGTAHTKYSGVKSITADLFGSSYRLRETGRGNGINTKDLNNSTSYGSAVDFTDLDNVWNTITDQDDAAYDAHYGSEMTYDFYYNTFGRNSYDNAGAVLNSYVHYDNGFVNAFWDGSQMTYGDGDGSSYTALTSLDVVGHEITHAVTEHTAGLNYSYESGALNESFSDVFGVVIDFINNPSTANYLMGDQISVAGVPFRNMANPNDYGDPDTYQGTYWEFGSSDNGGVHTNSGVQNFWFYLLTNGGSGTNDNGDAYTVNGIGMSSAADITYRNLSVYLTPSSNYADARFYSIQAAEDLYGTCSPEIIAVTNAWYAVGVGAVYNNAVIANFTANQTYSCTAPVSITFTNASINASAYLWNFGDGNTSTTTSPIHSYTTPGTYSVSLIANGTAACSTTDTINKPNYITVDNSSIVLASCSPSTYNPSTSTGIFNFSMGSINNSTNGSVDGYKDYSCSNTTTVTEGTYVNLSVTTSSSESAKVWIDFNNDGIFNMTNELVHFFDNTTNSSVHSVNLLVPQGSVYNTPLRLRVISELNSYSITDPCSNVQYGQVEDYSITILQNTNAPLVDFVADDTVVNIGQVVNFTDLSQNIPTGWTWTFNGASPTSSSIQNPSISYSSVGTYPVTLSAVNSNGSGTLTKSTYIHVINEYTMCSSPDSSNADAGQLFDSGGSTGNYGSNENCSFLINPGCAIDITLTFNSFYSPTSYDVMKVYDGVDASAPLITTYSYITTPPIPITATSGSMFITWTTNYSGNYSGFDASWTSTVPSSNPVASFSMSDNNPPLNMQVSFTDLSTNNIGAWNWDFGDGTSSNSQNPTHPYTVAGTYTVTLIVDNCFSLDTITQSITIQGSPIINVSPNPIIASVSCGDSITIPVMIYNTGSGDLVYNIENQMAIANDSLQVLALTYGVDYSQEYQNTLSSINQYFTNYNLTEVYTTLPAVLQDSLVGKHLLLLPENESGNAAVFSSFSTVIQDFINSGGSVVVCGTGSGYSSSIFNTNLFTGYFNSFNTSSSIPLNIVDASHPIMAGITPPFNVVNATSSYNLTNADLNSIVEFQGANVISTREVGDSKIILMGFDFYGTSINSSKAIANAFQWVYDESNFMSNWVDLSQLSDTVAVNDTSIVYITLNAEQLYAGTYYDTLNVYSNDVTNSPVVLPITFTVNGQPLIELSDLCLNLDTAMTGTTNSDTLTLFNSGCDTLDISSFVFSNADWSIDTMSLNIPPFSEYQVVISFTPSTISPYADTLYIYNNDVDTLVCLNGVGIGTPILTFDPLSINDTIFSCNDSLIIPVTIYNTGTGGLNTSVLLDEQSSVSNSYFFDGFEDGTYNNWTVQTTSNTYSIVNTNPGSGNYALSIVGGSTVGLIKTFTPDTIDYFSIKMRSDDVGGNSNYCYVGNSSLDYGIGLINLYQANQYIVIGNSSITYNISNSNDWTFFEFKNINYSTKTYDVYVNNTLLYPSMGFYNSSIQNMSTVKLFNYESFYPGYYDDITIGNQNLPNWISTSINTTNIAVNDSVIFNVTLYSDSLNSGTYSSNIVFNSNDPFNSADTLDVTLTVVGSPEISLSDTCLNLPATMQFTSSTDTLTITNLGCDTLFVTNVTSGLSEFSLDTTQLYILPQDSADLIITFSPTTVNTFSSYITIYNNDIDTTICLNATSVGAPIISFNPTSINDTIYSCNDSITIPVTLYNTGLGTLNTTIETNNQASESNSYFFDGFEDGTYNNWTVQTTSNTYSIVNTNPGSGNYALSIVGGSTSGLIKTFTPDTIDYFSIKMRSDDVGGNSNYCYVGNSSNNYGIGTIYLYQTNQYRVNGNTSVTYNISNSNDWTFFEFKNINYSTKTYDVYINNTLVYPNMGFNNSSTQNMSTVKLFNYEYTYPGYYDDITIGNQNLPNWISTSIDTANVAVSDSVTFNVTLYSDSLLTGSYSSNVIFNSNDPQTPSDTLDVTLTVVGSPEITLSDTCLNFGSIMQNTSLNDTLTIANTGCDTLFVTNITSGASEFSTDTTLLTILPNEYYDIIVTFNPLTVGTFNSFLTIYNNDIDTNICLSASSTAAPVIATDVDTLILDVTACDDSVFTNLTIYNQGLADLDWQISTSSNFNEDFEGGTNAQIWDNIYSGTVSSVCGTNSGGGALYFNGSVYRYAITNPFNVSSGGNISFYLKFGTGSSPCEYADGGEDVVLEYTTNNGTTWTTINTYYTFNYSYFTFIQENIPLAAQTPNTRFRWRQLSFSGSGLDNWSIDDISFNFTSLSNATPSSSTVTPGDSIELDLWFDVPQNGNAASSISIQSNDPLNPIIEVPVIFNFTNNMCADFSYTTNCSGEVSFTDLTPNPPTSWQWNFGDGSTSTLQNPSHLYTTSGTYTVQLIACDMLGCDTTTQVLNITVQNVPVTSCTPSSVYGLVSYGINSFSLNTINNTSTVLSSGYQDFTCSNSTLLTQGIYYTINASTINSNYVNYAIWVDLNNNGAFDYTEQLVFSTNTTAYTIIDSINIPANVVLGVPLRLRIGVNLSSYSVPTSCGSVDYGEYEDYTIFVQSNTSPPIVDYSFVITDNCEGIVGFTDLSTNFPTSWYWDFDDGNVSSLQNPFHVFSQPGIYNVELTASNGNGSSSIIYPVEINPLTVGFNVPDTAEVNQPLAFIGTSTAAITWEWDFGDSYISTLQNPVHAYTNLGTYTVELKVTDSFGCIKIITKDIVIVEKYSGLDEGYISNSKFDIYPNPNKGEMFIKNADNLEIDKITITNSLGQIVYVFDGTDQLVLAKRINIEAVETGIYYIKVEFNNAQPFIKRVIVH